ncbi:hypothetical protein DM02DRAFT_731808 [Periconia macrospinosa]|uniref:Uncharacterized protein n=1 Tax=Periconia macrospinosa TaxID=97972 RepID=A0A2V1DEH7_9PLEO|nr:hypothetical protein DM02DRAFT_731808 [Periconia macrospinosa]
MASAVSSIPPQEGNTTIALATLVPYSSDGPTLPLVGNSSAASRKKAASSNANDPTETANGEKRKSTTDDTNSTTPALKKAKTTDNTTLYTPWVLLPPELRRSVAERLGGPPQWDWETHCIPIVYTRNQNITSALNRLKAYLGHSPHARNSSIDVPEPLKGEHDGSSGGGGIEGGGGGIIISISAQADATTKLVGIVELAKRLLAESDVDVGTTDRRGRRKVVWYSYTSLSSRLQKVDINHEKKRERSGQDATATAVAAAHTNDDHSSEEEEIFETKNARVDGQEGKTRKIPILTVWISKTKIPEFKRAFGGEQSFEVCS